MRVAIPVVLFGLALSMATAEAPDWPVPPAVELGALRVDPAPLRPPRVPADEIDVGGVSLRCSECHALFESRPKPQDQLAQHGHIELDHGANAGCLNCHDLDDRNSLRTSGGVVVPLAESSTLCAGCHGPTWRDWQVGIHGRTEGSWDARSGLQSRLTCVACHDPHAPAFDELPAFPGPNTLRMGAQGVDAGHAARKRNPLHQWRGHAASQDPAAHTDTHDPGDGHDG